METAHFKLTAISDEPDPKYLEDFSATLSSYNLENRSIMIPADLDDFILELQELKKKFQRKKEDWVKQQRQNSLLGPDL